jgi:hypothetical protein
MDQLRDRVCSRVVSSKALLKTKLHRDGWILPKQTTSFAPEGTWTNVDLDVTPLERRIWTPLSFLGYWISDVVGELLNSHRVFGISADLHLLVECPIVAGRCFCTCDRFDLSRGCLLYHIGLICHGWGPRSEWRTWCLSPSSFPHLDSIRFRLSRSQTPSHLSHGDCTVLALYPDIYRISGDDCHAHGHLAKLCSYPQSSSGKCGYHKLGDVEPSAVLEPSTSISVDQTP